MPRDNPGTCETANCCEPAIVGYGSDPTWLCAQCFERALLGVRERLETAAELLDVTGPRP